MTPTREGNALTRQWGRAIRMQRDARKMSQVQLADAVGVKQSAVSQWERGHCAPTPHMQLKVANALGVDARLLFAYPQEVA